MTESTNDETGFIKVDQVAKNVGEVLVVDDNIIYTDLISENLNAIGVESKAVNSFTQIESLLKKHYYPVILCDNIDDKSKTIKGSEIILNNHDLFKDSQTVLVTGHPLTKIQGQAELLNRGVKILQKGAGHVEEILRITKETLDNRAKAIVQDAENYVNKLITNPRDVVEYDNTAPYEKLVIRTRERFKKYISRLPEPDTPQFYIKGKSLSPNQIISEFEKDDSEIGVLLIDILLEDALDGVTDD